MSHFEFFHNLCFVIICRSSLGQLIHTTNIQNFTWNIDMRQIVRIATTKVFLVLPQGNPQLLAEPFLSKRSGFSGTIIISQWSRSFQLLTLFNSEPFKKKNIQNSILARYFSAHLMCLNVYKIDGIAPFGSRTSPMQFNQ